MQKEIQNRLSRLRYCMKKEGIQFYLVFASDFHQSEYLDAYFKFREYLSGFTGSAGTLFIAEDRAILWTDGRYFVQAEKELAGTGIILFRMQEEGVPTLLEYLKSVINADACIGCDGRTISAALYEELLTLTKEKAAALRTELDFAGQVWLDRPLVTKHEVYMLKETVCGQSVLEKLRELERKLSESGADLYLITELSDIMWLFNLRGSDIAYNPVAFSYACIWGEQTFLFLNRESCTEQAAEALSQAGVSLRAYEEIDAFLDSLSERSVLCDMEAVNSSLYQRIKLKNTVVSVKNTDYIQKAVKNETEQELAREFHVLDAVAMIRFIIYIKEQAGRTELTEYAAAQYLNNLRAKNRGFVELSFETICAYKENAAIVHYSAPKAGSAVLKPVGMLLVDSGGQYLGATTDITRTIVLGTLKQEEKEHYTAVLKGMLRLSAAKFLEGCSGENLDILAREPIWQLGIDYRHGTGHGIGSFLNVHEGPQAFRYKINKKQPQPALRPGMITSDEPGIYIEGSHGIRLENELLCVEREKTGWGTFLGFETLTLVPFDLEAVLPAYMNAEEKQQLNVYHRKVYETLCPLLTDKEKLWLKEQTREI